ncbi:MAG TPA: alpha/beta fold hydrolase [Pyrinomonadaceae bacterium]
MTTSVIKSPWIPLRRLNPNASVRLFCFPYAGGGAQIYKNWQEGFPPSIEVCPVQLPGRGERVSEPRFSQIKPLVEAIAEALLPFFDRPFAFFGHSMGAAISYELAQLLRREKASTPIHLFVSGHSAPHLMNRQVITYDLPDDEFVKELRILKGTPEEVFEHPELMALMIPLLRADFEVSETYVGSNQPPLDCPITAFGGVEDQDVPPEKIEGWGAHTNGPFLSHILPGGHFFIHTEQPAIVRAVVRDLSRRA